MSRFRVNETFRAQPEQMRPKCAFGERDIVQLVSGDTLRCCPASTVVETSSERRVPV